MIKLSVDEIMNDVYMFSVVHNNVFSITNMSEEELRQSIIEDLLLVTMLEQEEKIKLHFGFTKFLRWLPRYLHKLVIKQLDHEEICGLIEKKDDQIRIKNDRAILQAAMDYCGHWWEGFDIPNQPGILKFNKEVFEEKVAKHGGFDNFVEFMSKEIMSATMDQEATYIGSKTLN